MSGTLSPVASQQFFDDNGDPLAGGFLYSYIAGTSTPTPIYANATLGTAYTNPAELDDAGRLVIYLDALSYKFILTDANGVQIWSVDPVASTGLSAASIGSNFFEFLGEEEARISNTTYNTGTAYTACHPDTVFFSIDSANLVGTYALSGMLKATTGTVTASIVNLSDGTPDTPLRSITSTSTAGELQTSAAITFAAGGTVKTYAIKTIVTSGSGYAWGLFLKKLS